MVKSTMVYSGNGILYSMKKGHTMKLVERPGRNQSVCYQVKEVMEKAASKISSYVTLWKNWKGTYLNDQWLLGLGEGVDEQAEHSLVTPFDVIL